MQEGGSDADRRAAIAEEEKLFQDQGGEAAKKPIQDVKNYQGSANFYFD